MARKFKDNEIQFNEDDDKNVDNAKKKKNRNFIKIGKTKH